MFSQPTRVLLGSTMVAILAGLSTACGGSATSTGTAGDGTGLSGAADLAEQAEQVDLEASKVDSIAADVPEPISDDGELSLAHVAGQYPPIGFTLPGSEDAIGFLPDLEVLIAQVLGLEPKYGDDSFEGAFLGIASGKYELLVSQVSVTPDRLEQYDMATFGSYKFALVAKSDSTLEIDELTDLSGLTVATKPGTYQYGLLVQWNKELTSEGLDPIDLKGYADPSGSRLALQSGKIDVHMTIGAVADFEASLEGSPTRVVGHYPGLEGADGMEGNLIATLSQKGNGLAQPVCDALNHLIETGVYAELLEKWHLEDYGIDKCVVNPDVSL